MNQLAKTPADMIAALAGASSVIQQENPAGMPFLKLNKVGYWVYGEDSMEVEEDSMWAINPESFVMGFVAFPPGETLGAPIGEKMASIYGAAVVESALPPVESKWQRQVGMQLVCLDGDDEGEQVKYMASTNGGTKEFGSLLKQVMTHLQSAKAGKKTVPVVELLSDSYKHPSFGLVYTPSFNIVKWVENTGFDAADEVEVEPEVEKAPPRKRASKKKAAVVEEVVEDVLEEEEEEEVDDKPAPRRRRRRK